jgi:HD-GYP domain-containing protein (c-di-GMP phosphodiesterase class II)
MTTSSRTALDSLRKLSAVGIALSAEKDEHRLMELILESARELTHADGGTVYRIEDGELRFEIMITDSLGIRMGGTSGRSIDLPPVPLRDAEGRPNQRMVAARSAATGETVNLADAYDATEFDFGGTREFDARTGYRSKSFLTVPMRNHEDEVVGVLQLINAKDDAGAVVPFSEVDQYLVEALASQAAISYTKHRLIDDQRRLFESFIQLIAAAIDDKSPYTGGHCRRVPELTMMLADAAAATREGPLADFRMSEDDRYELHIAGWLHDCGKVTTPEHVVDKATKLQTIFDRIHLVDTRFEVLKRDVEIRALRDALDALGGAPDPEALERGIARGCAVLDAERAFLRGCNVGVERMAREDQERVRRIGARRWRGVDGNGSDFLTEDELTNLTIERGTLTAEERAKINHHIVATIRMLESLPYPRNLRRVPELAGGHHERMDGRGYPKGLTREQMSVPARVMGIADIFEALTAGDRPYKGAMKLSEALRILGRMKLDDHIDPDLFDVFMRSRVWLRYAERFLEPEQIDEVDLGQIPGYRPHPEDPVESRGAGSASP